MEIELSTELKQLVNSYQANLYRVIPKMEDESAVHFYCDEAKKTLHLSEELGVIFDKQIYLHGIESERIDELLNRFYFQNEEMKSNMPTLNSEDFLKDLIVEAEDHRCSDIHLESYENRCRIRMRIDGLLIERFVIPKERYVEYVNKIKILSNLDIAEKRLPQDGRILLDWHDRQVDIRVSTLPVMSGEKVVMRLLTKRETISDIDSLGFNSKQKEAFLNAINKPNGLVLISGPTGSGKTTTLYSALKILNKDTRNILTIEDPIEYTLEGINQVQLKEKIGLEFSAALKTFLRQDPDVIMVGEVRDIETANMAARASLTGHLVLSTVHTNSAWGIITRLTEMGISPHILAEVLSIAIAQRLVRLLCPHCKRRRNNHYVSVGCDKCYRTGYRGRKAIYEIIQIDDHVKAIIQDPNRSKRESEVNVIGTLKESAMELHNNGLTSREEVLNYI